MTNNKSFNMRFADKWPLLLALLILISFTFVGCQQFLQQAPTAVIDATPTSGAAPLDVDFDGSGSSDPDGNIASYAWDFGDGNTGTGQTASHTYTTEDQFTAVLTVTDNDGLTDTAQVTIDTRQPPTAVASASPTEGEAPLEVDFDGSGSSDNGTIASYEWDFGDGNTGTGETVTHTYQSQGVFDAILTVTDDDGYTDTDKVTINTLTASIYFASERSSYNIYRMDTEGSNQAQVTSSTSDVDNIFPALLYNTRLKLAFASDRDDGSSGTNNKFDIFKSEVDGTLPVNLTTQTAYSQIEPSWNNDGSKITYASNETGDWEIWVMSNSGSGKTQLTSQTASTELAPVFSPDGTKIVYVSDKDGDHDIWLMDADGSNQENIYDSGSDDGGLGADPFSILSGFGFSTPSWSPDGTKIAFTSDKDGDNDIYVIDSDGSNLKSITSETGLNGDNNFDPFWLPNGDEIAFVSEDGGQYEIWKVDVSDLDNPGGVDQLATLGNNLSPANEPWNK